MDQAIRSRTWPPNAPFGHDEGRVDERVCPSETEESCPFEIEHLYWRARQDSTARMP